MERSRYGKRTEKEILETKNKQVPQKSQKETGENPTKTIIENTSRIETTAWYQKYKEKNRKKSVRDSTTRQIKRK